MAIQTNKITSDLVNTVQIDDIDLKNDNECNELGKIVSHSQIQISLHIRVVGVHPIQMCPSGPQLEEVRSLGCSDK